MSIINQALQKAQREQLRHSQQEMPYRLPVQRTRVPRRRWLLAPLGLVAAVGVGATLHAWFLTPTGHVPVPTEIAASSPLVISIPPATSLPVTPGVQAGTEPALPGPTKVHCPRCLSPLRSHLSSCPQTLPSCLQTPLRLRRHAAIPPQCGKATAPCGASGSPLSRRGGPAQALVQRATAAQEAKS